MKTDSEVLVDRDDLEMMKRPHLWPKQSLVGEPGVLCLRRRNPTKVAAGDPFPYDYGRLRADSSRVYVLGNTLDTMLDVVGHEDYDSAEAVFAAGWAVD